MNWFEKILEFLKKLFEQIDTTTTTSSTSTTINPTYTFEATLDHQENRSNYKGCCLLNTSMGLFSSVYDNNSRKNSELSLNWNRIYSGSQETIGQGIEYNNKVYFPTEYSKGLVFSGGALKETVPLRHSSLAMVYKDTPCFVSSESDGEFIINAENGAKVKQLAVGVKVGIPFSSALLPNSKESIIVLADNNGSESLVTTTDIVIYLPGVTTVENWRDQIYAGAMGKIFKVNISDKKTTQIYDTGSQVVNQLWNDQENGILWISCSRPDKLMYMVNVGDVKKVIEVNDTTGSGLFDTRVTKGWWLRANSARATWYKITKKN